MWVLGVLLLAPGTSYAGWKEVRIGRVPYVSFTSFCEFYHFDPPKQVHPDTFELSGPYGSLVFRINSQDCWINGVRYWLSFPLIQRDDEVLIPRVDLIKTLEPVLRPDSIAPRMPVKGVIIDAGHGGADRGAVASGGLMEKEITLDTALRLQRILKEQKIPTVLTRADDSFPTLEGRARYTQRYPGYIFVSLHYNQGSSTSHGVETFCLTPCFAPSTSSEGRRSIKDDQSQPGNPTDVENILLASLVHREVVKLHNTEGDRGVKRARFAVLRQAVAPAVLVEGGFLSDRRGDLKLLKSTQYRESLAQKVANGILKYMEIMGRPEGVMRQIANGVDFRDSRPVVNLRATEPEKKAPAPTHETDADLYRDQDILEEDALADDIPVPQEKVTAQASANKKEQEKAAPVGQKSAKEGSEKQKVAAAAEQKNTTPPAIAETKKQEASPSPEKKKPAPAVAVVKSAEKPVTEKPHVEKTDVNKPAVAEVQKSAHSAPSADPIIETSSDKANIVTASIAPAPVNLPKNTVLTEKVPSKPKSASVDPHRAITTMKLPEISLKLETRYKEGNSNSSTISSNATAQKVPSTPVSSPNVSQKPPAGSHAQAAAKTPSPTPSAKPQESAQATKVSSKNEDKSGEKDSKKTNDQDKEDITSINEDIVVSRTTPKILDAHSKAVGVTSVQAPDEKSEKNGAMDSPDSVQ